MWLCPFILLWEGGKLFTYFKLASVNFLSFKYTFLSCPVSFGFVNRVEMGSNLISDGESQLDLNYLVLKCSVLFILCLQFEFVMKRL